MQDRTGNWVSNSKPEPSDVSINVGVGGWAYFPIRNANKLEICSKLYDFVEINSTFYKLPPIESARKWRKSVPEYFEFTIRANRRLTHENHLEPSEENIRLHHKQLELCSELNASILHFQFPPSFEITKDVLKNWRDFLGSATQLSRWRNAPYLAFEIRNSKSKSLPALSSFFQEHDIIPTQDASKEPKPSMSSESKILYSRVFGFGEHTRWSFDSEELRALKKNVESIPARKRYVTFHNLTMYEDASRMRSIVKSGRELASNSESGSGSFKRALTIGTLKFPASKQYLIEKSGWKTYEESSGEKFHLTRLLNRLPDERKFESLEEITRLIQS